MKQLVQIIDLEPKLRLLPKLDLEVMSDPSRVGYIVFISHTSYSELAAVWYLKIQSFKNVVGGASIDDILSASCYVFHE